MKNKPVNPLDKDLDTQMSDSQDITTGTQGFIVVQKEVTIETFERSKRHSYTVLVPASPKYNSAVCNIPVHGGKKSFSRFICKLILIDIPLNLGRFVMIILGRDNVSNNSFVILGYVIIFIGVSLFMWGILDFHTMVNTLKHIWRFFYPVGN